MDIVKILDRYSAGDEFQRPVESAIEEINKLRQRVAELEKERDDWQDEALGSRISIETLTTERDALKQQRDELVAAAEAIEIDAEECLDFDECTAMLVPIDTYHKLIEAIASINEK